MIRLLVKLCRMHRWVQHLLQMSFWVICIWRQVHRLVSVRHTVNKRNLCLVSSRLRHMLIAICLVLHIVPNSSTTSFQRSVHRVLSPLILSYRQDGLVNRTAVRSMRLDMCIMLWRWEQKLHILRGRIRIARSGVRVGNG